MSDDKLLRSLEQAQRGETTPWEEIRSRPYKRWFEFGWRGPSILWSRLRNSHYRLLQPRRTVRHWHQRIRYGVSNEDCWSLDYFLARVTVHGVQKLREWANGYPGELESWEEWDAILVRIQDGFQAWLDEDGWFFEKPEQRARFDDGIALYAKWFGALWD